EGAGRGLARARCEFRACVEDPARRTASDSGRCSDRVAAAGDVLDPRALAARRGDLATKPMHYLLAQLTVGGTPVHPHLFHETVRVHWSPLVPQQLPQQSRL